MSKETCCWASGFNFEDEKLERLMSSAFPEDLPGLLRYRDLVERGVGSSFDLLAWSRESPCAPGTAKERLDLLLLQCRSAVSKLIAMEAVVESKRFEPRGDWVYGEVDIDSVRLLLSLYAEEATASRKDGTPTSFFDLGSGCGKLVFAAAVHSFSAAAAAAAAAGAAAAAAAAVAAGDKADANTLSSPPSGLGLFQRCIGIEAMVDHHAIGQLLAEDVRRDVFIKGPFNAAPPPPTIELRCASVLNGDGKSEDGEDKNKDGRGDLSWLDGDLVLCNCAAWEAGSVTALSRLAVGMRPGAVLILIQQELNPSAGFELLEMRDVKTCWARGVPCLVYKRKAAEEGKACVNNNRC